ncbi:MAG: hypothetical protein C4288_07330 [Leptolyngbya sp. ERB_1_1]
MKDLDRKTQNWSLYKDLELLPTSETRRESIPTFGLNRLWRGLLGLLADELIEEQRVEYLERCLQKTPSESQNQVQRDGVQQFLKLIE